MKTQIKRGQRVLVSQSGEPIREGVVVDAWGTNVKVKFPLFCRLHYTKWFCAGDDGVKLDFRPVAD